MTTAPRARQVNTQDTDLITLAAASLGRDYRCNLYESSARCSSPSLPWSAETSSIYTPQSRQVSIRQCQDCHRDSRQNAKLYLERHRLWQSFIKHRASYLLRSIEISSLVDNILVHDSIVSSWCSYPWSTVFYSQLSFLSFLSDHQLNCLAVERPTRFTCYV